MLEMGGWALSFYLGGRGRRLRDVPSTAWNLFTQIIYILCITPEGTIKKKTRKHTHPVITFRKHRLTACNEPAAFFHLPILKYRPIRPAKDATGERVVLSRLLVIREFVCVEFGIMIYFVPRACFETRGISLRKISSENFTSPSASLGGHFCETEMYAGRMERIYILMKFLEITMK